MTLHDFTVKVYLSLVGSHTANQIRRQTIDKHSEPESRLRDGGKALTQRVGKFLQNAEQELNAITTFDQLIEAKVKIDVVMFLARFSTGRHVGLVAEDCFGPPAPPSTAEAAAYLAHSPDSPTSTAPESPSVSDSTLHHASSPPPTRSSPEIVMFNIYYIIKTPPWQNNNNNKNCLAQVLGFISDFILPLVNCTTLLWSTVIGSRDSIFESGYIYTYIYIYKLG
ncbi:uncharacterized protein LOC123200801 [Mangifera indica]|uniref:uncharacterized protein LOC123200801 n=1 Tax=Mangifera indica TaxID=29780 RepID=UPI001CFB26D6|nr:uncharacterized protein LOC123200801 [Mangifera indica]